MALIVEDGTIVADAESYVTVSAFVAYWTARNDATTAALASSVIEGVLREATAFLETNYKWTGLRVSTLQALAWPRVLPAGLDRDGRAVSATEIPKALRDACCELAKGAVSGPLAETVDRGGAIKSESVDSINVTYMDGAPAAKKYQMVDLLLRNLVQGGGSSLTSTSRRS